MATAERDQTIKEVDDARAALRKMFKENAEGLQNTCYNFLDGISLIGVAFFKAGGEEGWADGVALSDGKLLTEEEQREAEAALAPYKSELGKFKANEDSDSSDEDEPRMKPQAGGGPILKKNPAKGLKQPSEVLNSFQKNVKAATNKAQGIVNPPPVDFTFSLDGAVKKVSDYIQAVDNQVHEITDSLGPTAFINNMPVDPFIPNPLQVIGIPPPKFQVPKYSILPFFDSLLEVIRLIAVFMPNDIPLFRKITSITKAIYELSLGNWRQAIFSFIGYFGQSVGRMSSIGKIVFQAWLMIDPSISGKLSKYAYKGVKSMFITFWLYLFQIFSPDFIWIPIGKFLDGINNLVDQGQSSISSLEEQFTKSLQSMGYEGYSVHLPTLEEITGQPDGAPPIRFSFDDLQNLQTLITMPFFLCSKEGQTIIGALAKTPARLVLELLNIPTLPEDIADMCGVNSAEQMKGLAVTLAENIVKQTSIQGLDGAAMKGGAPKKKRTAKVRLSKQRRKTRRHRSTSS